ncbi:MAG TPA: hypothetical protein VIO64_17285 [Pseudobacteroides sp.]|uniref:hypothetical protein n=1 Tax=Pseudobacteroides sp. TaxID=1968840 RepID=UPI002F93DBAC
MRKKQQRKNTAIGLVVLMIFSLCGLLTFSEGQKESLGKLSDLDNLKPFQYGLFSGDENSDFDLRGRNIQIIGDMHTNAAIKIYEGDLKIISFIGKGIIIARQC